MPPEYGPYFFLSYARTEPDPTDNRDPDRYAFKFFRDLRADVRSLIKLTPDAAGFIDRQNQAGENWKEKLAAALATCRVFIPLYSQQYFQSINCGREWYAFTRREANHMTQGNESISAIIPVMWLPVARERMPEATRYLHDSQEDLGRRYQQEGLFPLVKLDRYRRDYQTAVFRLAQHIVSVAAASQITTEEPCDFDSLPNPFDEGLSGKKVQIALLSLDTSSALPPGRRADYYGASPLGWRPYYPESRRSLADHAKTLAARLGCVCEVSTFDDYIAYWNRNTEPTAPCVCLVDPWTALSPQHQEKLRQLDELKAPLVNVLLPLNSSDAQTSNAEAALRSSLGNLLGRKLESVPHRCQTAATGVRTPQEFSEVLPRMIAIMLKDYHRVAAVPVPAEKPYRRRRLSGPGPDDGDNVDGDNGEANNE
jgi:FxsC-like protein